MSRIVNQKNKLFDEATKESVLLLQGLPTSKGRYLKIHGQQYLDFATAGYLGLDCDDEFTQMVILAVKSFGLGRCASPMYVVPEYYEIIGKQISGITGLPGILLFNSNSMANSSAICYGLPTNCQFFTDEYCHRSLVEALKLHRNRMQRYPHMDIAFLKNALEKNTSGSVPVIVTDGVFSMSGSKALVNELYEIIQQRNGYLIIDDAHGFAVEGMHGEGVLNQLKYPELKNLIYIGSLTKALSGFGGFIACSKEIVEKIKINSPQYGFSCSIPLLYAAVSAHACKLIGSTKWRRKINDLEQNWKILNEGLLKVGRSLMAPFSPIAVLKASDEKEIRRLCLALKDRKIAFNVVGFPAVPKRDYRIRLCLSASHTESDMTYLTETLIKALT
jgi:8-amino-7-oxononanoate synthase